MDILRLLNRPLARLPFVFSGTVLFALKVAIDRSVARSFHHPYSVIFYVSPMASPVLHPQTAPTYWFAMWAVAIPFITVGLILTRRRVLDAGLPPWLSLLFFVPFANLLFFLGLTAVPSRPLSPLPVPLAPYRQGAPIPVPPPDSTAHAVMPGLVGAVIGLGAMALSVGILRQYGSALFVGTPAIAAFSATLLHGRWNHPTLRGAVLSTALSFGLFFIVTLAFALEGIVCLLMALPLLTASAAVGCLVGYAITRHAAIPAGVSPGAAVMALPMLFLAEQLNPLPPPIPLPVESSVVVNAPPSVVWDRVIAFPPLAPPTEAIFRLGVAAPMRAVIHGHGVGAIRRCEFTTGAFVEPVTVWNPGRELGFDVTAQPTPMRELTLWPGPRPPHLDGYIQSTHGQFRLVPLPGHRTLLIGRTWYLTRITPEGYWRFWTDRMIHAIHLRVLRHVAALAESDVRST